MQFSKIFLSETTRPRAFIFGIQHHLEVLYQSCSNYVPGVKIDPAPGVLIGSISRSWGQKLGFLNAIFKNLFV